MKNAHFASKSFAFVALLLFTACGGGSGGGLGNGGGGSLYIESCSLGCNYGAAGNPVGCSIGLVGINPEFVVLFSGPVDLQSVDNQSFRFQNSTTGNVPQFQ